MGRRASYSVLDLVSAVEEATERSLEPRFGPPRPCDIKHSFADFDRALARLGCELHVAFDDGVGMTYRGLLGGLRPCPIARETPTQA